MKFWQRKLSLSLILVIALVVLLPILAVLQYRLLGQVSESERERMQNILRASTEKFQQDFDRELTRAYLSFQPRLSEGREVNWQTYPERYEKWFATAPFPQLVSQVYRLECNDSRLENFEIYDREARTFKASEWPAEMTALRDTFEQVRQRTNQIDLSQIPVLRNLGTLPTLKATKKDGTSTNQISIMLSTSTEPLIEEIPALVLPVMLPTPAAHQGNPVLYNLIVKLDLDYIKSELIPTLARRYFAAGETLDYHLAVVSRQDPTRIIYQSDGELHKRAAVTPDAVTDIFALRMDEIENLSTDANVTAMPSGDAIKTTGDRLAIQVFNSHITRTKPTVAHLDANEGQWQMMLQHRAGSLETVVASARRRNLLLSSGILALLSASLILIIILTRRAQRLAEQQMEFVAGITHELRTPLAVIRSAGENLADGVIDERSQVKRYGSLIAGEGRRLSEMVEQILEFSGIHGGRKKYMLRPVTVSEVIADAIAACTPMLEEGGFDLRREVENDLPMVAADEGALSRSMQNLLTNAMKYSGNNRMIEVKAQSQKTVNGREVRITVTDGGVGISPEELSHIFEPFYRGHEATAAQIHGSGLGLSLVKQIMEAHNGRVSVTSQTGKGSAFTLHLPATTDAREARGAEIELAT